MSEVADDDPLFLASNGPTPTLLHQEEYPLTIFSVATMEFWLVHSKVMIVQEADVVVELANQGTANNVLVRKRSQDISLDFVASHIRSKTNETLGGLRDHVFVLVDQRRGLQSWKRLMRRITILGRMPLLAIKRSCSRRLAAYGSHHHRPG